VLGGRARQGKGLFLLIMVLSFSCGRAIQVRHPPPYGVGMVIDGVASWYGIEDHGRPTASGEIYNMFGLTAAHRTWPFGTIVRVTNKKNGKSVIIRVNDRGPFVEGRDIDLSYGAARAIDMVEDGVVPVRMTILSWPDKATGSPIPYYTLQVGAFMVKDNAERLQQELERVFDDVYIVIKETWKERYYRVRVGRFKTPEAAEEVASSLRQRGYEVFLTRCND